MTDIPPDKNQGVENNDETEMPLPDPDGETERNGGSDEEGLEGLRNLS